MACTESSPDREVPRVLTLTAVCHSGGAGPRVGEREIGATDCLSGVLVPRIVSVQRMYRNHHGSSAPEV